jgi:uncharacterized RDD family membrane protein YckC
LSYEASFFHEWVKISLWTEKMKNIEIKTTQNVVLQYELADLRDRIVAFLIDIACVFFVILILSAAGTSLFMRSETSATIWGIFLTCIFMFYSLAFEVWNGGQSIGKMAMRIQVIKTVGGTATFSDYAARWVFRMVDVYFSLGGIASILIASSSKAQRLGDIVANTAVIKLKPRMDLNLKDLLSIHSQESYKPEYHQARQLEEEDVLLIKSTLDRNRQFNNDAHEEAIDLLADKIKQVLEIDNVQVDNIRFLQTILRDYVILTR